MNYQQVSGLTHTPNDTGVLNFKADKCGKLFRSHPIKRNERLIVFEDR